MGNSHRGQLGSMRSLSWLYSVRDGVQFKEMYLNYLSVLYAFFIYHIHAFFFRFSSWFCGSHFLLSDHARILLAPIHKSHCVMIVAFSSSSVLVNHIAFAILGQNRCRSQPSIR